MGNLAWDPDMARDGLTAWPVSGKAVTDLVLASMATNSSGNRAVQLSKDAELKWFIEAKNTFTLCRKKFAKPLKLKS